MHKSKTWYLVIKNISHQHWTQVSVVQTYCSLWFLTARMPFHLLQIQVFGGDCWPYQYTQDLHSIHWTRLHKKLLYLFSSLAERSHTIVVSKLVTEMVIEQCTTRDSNFKPQTIVIKWKWKFKFLLPHFCNYSSTIRANWYFILAKYQSKASK